MDKNVRGQEPVALFINLHGHAQEISATIEANQGQEETILAHLRTARNELVVACEELWERHDLRVMDTPNHGGLSIEPDEWLIERVHEMDRLVGQAILEPSDDHIRAMHAASMLVMRKNATNYRALAARSSGVVARYWSLRAATYENRAEHDEILAQGGHDEDALARLDQAASDLERMSEQLCAEPGAPLSRESAADSPVRTGMDGIDGSGPSVSGSGQNDAVLDEVFDRIVSGARDGHSKPITQIGLILERSSRIVVGSELIYETNLPPHLLSLRLNRDQQREVVERLYELIKSGMISHELFWAMGKASPWVMIAPMLDLLWNYSDAFALAPIVARQAMIALDNCLVLDRHTGRLFPEIARQLEVRDPSALLRTMSRSDNRDVAELAGHILDKLMYRAPEGEWQPQDQS